MRSRQEIRAYAAAAGMLFLAAPLRAQNAPCLRRTVVANVVDEKGNPVPGLTAADFVGRFRGKPVKILAATFDQQPRRIVILLDTSGSMDTFLLKGPVPIFEVLRERIARSSSGNFFALATFADHFQRRLDFSKDRNALDGQVRTIEEERKKHVIGKGHTALWDSVVAAIALFGQPSPDDALFLVSDGGDNESKHRPRDVQRNLLDAGIRLFVFAPLEPIGSRPPSEEEEGPRNLQRLVEATGGNLIGAVNGFVTGERPKPPVIAYVFADELKAALAQLYRQMDESYRLEVTLPEEVEKLRDWDLKFADEKSARKKHLVLLYQRKIAPCVTAAP